MLVVGTPKGGHVQVGSLLCDGVNISPNAGLVLMGRKFSGVLVTAWEARIGTPNECTATLLNADNRSPQSRPRPFDAIIQQLTMVGVEAIDGAVCGFEAAVGHPRSAMDKSVEGSSGKQPTGPTLRCEVEEIFPGIGAGAMTGSSEHGLAAGTSKGGLAYVVGLLCDGVSSSPNAGLVLMGCKFSGVPDAIIYQLNKVGVQVLEVLVVWMLEDELARMRIDAVNTDVTNEESARPWCVEGEVLCVSYSVLGIYFGRRR